MATKKKTIAIKGSKKEPYLNAREIAPAPADERFEVTLRLRPRTPLPDAKAMLQYSGAPIQQLTHEEYDAQHGVNPKDFIPIRKFAREHNLTVVRESIARRSVMLAGTVTDFNSAFGVTLRTYAHATGTYRGRTGSICIPIELAEIVQGVFGLDNRPVAGRHAAKPRASTTARPFSPTELARLYNFPPGVDGTGQTIAIIELGGGYRPEDLDAYFKSLKLPVPAVIPVSVDGAANSPSKANSDDGEVVLDIEVAAAVAPGAKIVVYFAPNDRASKGFIDALTKAIHDTQNNPSVISISWGGNEDTPTTSFQTQFDQALQTAALLGITVCVASGDDGAADQGPKVWDGKPHVDFPAASPFALACGGTRVIEANGAIKSESVWNQNKADVSDPTTDGSFGSGGGGVSDAFPMPAYQKNAKVPLSPRKFKGRGVPDVSGNADPNTGYNILVDGQSFAEGGTSAVAPLWAGLIACVNQKLKGRVGFINPQIYALPPGVGAFHDIITGNNRCTFKTHKSVGYDAVPGWDACTGLGTPDGVKLAASLTAQSPAAPKTVTTKATRRKAA